MSWSAIEGTEKAAHYREEQDDRIGTVLCWDGEPVNLPLRTLFTSWTTPWGARNHHAIIPFENGWHAELRYEEGAPSDTSASGLELPHPERLTLAGINQQGIDTRDRLIELADESGEAIDFEDDLWSLRQEYEYPGAYVQWYLLAVPENEEVDVALIAQLYEEGPWNSVPDLDTLQSRLQIIATMPSDPEEAACVQREA